MNTQVTDLATTGTANRPERYIRPAYRVLEESDAFIIHVFLPGVARSGVEINLVSDELVIHATRTNLPPKEWKLHAREIPVENYRLRLQLNVEVKGDEITAKTEDGVLTLTLPKAESVKPRTIAIE